MDKKTSVILAIIAAFIVGAALFQHFQIGDTIGDANDEDNNVIGLAFNVGQQTASSKEAKERGNNLAYNRMKEQTVKSKAASSVKCTDSDSGSAADTLYYTGVDIYKKGEIKGYDITIGKAGGVVTYSDYCYTVDTVFEYTCSWVEGALKSSGLTVDEGGIAWNPRSCGQGYVCTDGACILAGDLVITDVELSAITRNTGDVYINVYVENVGTAAASIGQYHFMGSYPFGNSGATTMPDVTGTSATIIQPGGKASFGFSFTIDKQTLSSIVSGNGVSLEVLWLIVDEADDEQELDETNNEFATTLSMDSVWLV